MAVIGVSLKNNRHPANVIYNKNNLRYPVKVFPVNPNGGVLQGEKIFSHISEIPEKVEPPVFVLKTVDDDSDIPDVDLSKLITDIDGMDPINIIEYKCHTKIANVASQAA